VEVVQNSKGIEIPESIVTAKPRETVVVMLTKDELFVQGERVASIADVKASTDTIIAPLREALLRPRIIGKAMAEREIAEREVTVMADKSLPYEVLKKVMSTCTDADFGKISFATMQKDKALDPGVFKAK
jgi:biopolymer transport protein TolR